MSSARSQLRLLITAMLLCACASAVASTQEQTHNWFEQARTAAEASDPEAVLAPVNKILAQRPGEPRALYLLAQARARQGEQQAALGLLRRLAVMGLILDPAEDPAFDSLRGTAELAGISARFRDNGAPRGRAVHGFKHNDRRFLPHGIAYDFNSRQFFIGSVHRRQIISAGRGREDSADFVSPGAFGLHAAMGMQAESSRRLLWVASSAVPEMQGYDSDLAGHSALFAFDLDSGRIKKRLPAPEDQQAHQYVDVAVAGRGRLFVADSAAGQIYEINRINGDATALLEPGRVSRPLGLELNEDETQLYFADYDSGLYALTLESGELRRITTAESVNLYGIVDLSRDGDQFIAVQTGHPPQRILRFSPDPDSGRVEQVEVLLANDERLQWPSSGIVVSGSYYLIANAHHELHGERQHSPRDAELTWPLVLRIPLD